MLMSFETTTKQRSIGAAGGSGRHDKDGGGVGAFS